MARVELEELGDEDPARLYLASGLGEGQRVEAALDAQGIDYAVVLEEFVRNVFFLFPAAYTGAAFYVRPADGDRARAALAEAGLSRGLVQSDS